MHGLTCIALVHVVSLSEEGETRYLLLIPVEIHDVLLVFRFHYNLTMVVVIVEPACIVIVQCAIIALADGGWTRDESRRQAYLRLVLRALDLSGKVILIHSVRDLVCLVAFVRQSLQAVLQVVELALRMTACVVTVILLAELLKLVLKVLIGTVRLDLIEHARAWVFHLYLRHLYPSLFYVLELDRLEELMLLDLVDA